MNEILSYELLETGNYTLRISNVFSVLFYIAIIIIIAFILKKLIYKSKHLDIPKKFTINKLIHYVLTTISVVICLHLLGFNISVLLAGSAALLVGIGFGLQNLFSDFISGIILLLDGTLSVNDYIEVNGEIYQVQEINFRTTRLIGRDENYVIMPNSELTANKVENWTYDKISSRFKINIGVEYSTDVELMMTTVQIVTQNHAKVLQAPKPFVRFEDYGNSALHFSVYFYSNEIFRIENIKSELRVEIFKALKKNNIGIPFPQRVVHIKNNT
ncbi:MAG: mechanosensitive ion channel [Bacteroidales bacterium]|jgi:small-conductance mechanosensitive channel|nr:mechanosensitive ion channel [Bacteroidales bacterium]